MTTIPAPHVETFFDTATFTATHLVSDPETGHAAIIDPVLDYEPRGATLSTASADRLLAHVAARGLTLDYVLETHAHADHLSAGDHIRRATGARLAIGADITIVQARFKAMFEADDVFPDGRAFNILLAEGNRLPLGSLSITTLHTPGHTPACVTYVVGDAAFIGDTLFMPDYGTARCDFPGGSATALYRSIRKILALPPETRLFVGHDYLPEGRRDYRWQTSVADQCAGNIHIHDGISQADFVAMRQARDATLPPPALILPSLQVNIRGGALPPPHASGRSFLSLPVTLKP